MLQVWPGVVAVVAACGYPPLMSVGDAGQDAVSVELDAPACFGSKIQVCFTVIPSAPVVLTMSMGLAPG